MEIAFSLCSVASFFPRERCGDGNELLPVLGISVVWFFMACMRKSQGKLYQLIRCTCSIDSTGAWWGETRPSGASRLPFRWPDQPHFRQHSSAATIRQPACGVRCGGALAVLLTSFLPHYKVRTADLEQGSWMRRPSVCLIASIAATFAASTFPQPFSQPHHHSLLTILSFYQGIPLASLGQSNHTTSQDVYGKI